nr:hypothetical protein CFP56_63456 [Quercus suber]
MRTSPFLLALPGLATAAEQVPLLDHFKGWFARATDSLSSALPQAPSSVPSVPNPVVAAGAAAAGLSVQPLTKDNYAQLLVPGATTASPGIEEWMVFVTGGNKTCFGLCSRAETAWNESTALLAATPSSPKLALLNCEREGQLCAGWAASPPSVLYMHLPQPLPDQSTPATTVRYIQLNRTTITAPEIASLAIQEKYKETAPYEGIFHPFDGQIAKLGVTIPAGYALWGFAQIPSWAFMIVVSFVSRTFMGRRTAPQGPRAGAAAPARAN